VNVSIQSGTGTANLLLYDLQTYVRLSDREVEHRRAGISEFRTFAA
jgi:hypothetical protein